MARVLVVYDERKLRRTFMLYLREDGHEIETAASVEEATAVLERNGEDELCFDVIVTDSLPERSGLSLLKSIRKRWPALQFILTTNEGALEGAVSAVRGGAHSYIFNPVTPAKLRNAVASAAEVKAARDAAHQLLQDKQTRRDELVRVAAARDQLCERLCKQLSARGVRRLPALLPDLDDEEAELPKPNSKRILVVDDERTLRRVFSMFLSDEGLEVETADNVDEGIAAIERSYAQGSPFSIVVSDIIMPGRHGTALMEEIAARWPELKLIIVTGEPTMESAALAVRTGAYEYMYKPVSSYMIRKVVTNAVELKAAEDEERRLASLIDHELAILTQRVEARDRELAELRELIATPRA